MTKMDRESLAQALDELKQSYLNKRVQEGLSLATQLSPQAFHGHSRHFGSLGGSGRFAMNRPMSTKSTRITVSVVKKGAHHHLPNSPVVKNVPYAKQSGGHFFGSEEQPR